MCEHKPSWVGPWCSVVANLVDKEKNTIVDDVFQYRRHCYCEECNQFWTEFVEIEELWDKSLGYKDLPRN